MGLAEYVCDECTGRSARRCARPAKTRSRCWAGASGALCAMYCALHPVGAVRNAVLLTTPIDPSGSLYARWVGDDEFDVDFIADRYAPSRAPGSTWRTSS